MRSWENSREISEIYYLISRNKRQIKDQAKIFYIKQSGNNYIYIDKLINILNRLFSYLKLDYGRWKLIVNIADKDKNGLIDIDLLFNLVVSSSNLNTSHPKLQKV